MKLRRTNSRQPGRHRNNKRLGVEHLEQRQLLTSVPLGAGSRDLAEFLLGSIAVNVVFLESNGAVDASTEDWNEELREGVKANIEEALTWWQDTLALYSDVHQLDFTVDYTLADDPVETRYEPISRNSNDFRFWIEDFFRSQDGSPSIGFTNEIFDYNHAQRLVHDTNWSFTIFVVNADNDEDGFFGDAQGRTDFRNAFAFPGGRFITMPHHRPPQTIAHEIAHMFWAHDEYGGSGDNYTDRRGYYNTQNTNALDGHPDSAEREPSLLNRLHSPFVNHQLSQAAAETLGWRDSDGDGIFDVLDVEPITVGVPEFDSTTRTIRFEGNSAVRTLENQNSSGTGNDITINQITDLQYRIDAGPWIDLAEFDDQYNVSIDVTTEPIPVGSKLVEFRTIDDRIGLSSNRVAIELPAGEPTTTVDVDLTTPESDPDPVEQEPTEPEPVELELTEPEPVEPIERPVETEPELVDPVTVITTNPENEFDVNGDGFVSAIDVLRVINAINSGDATATTSGPPYVDVTGDGFVTSLDALRIINHINAQTSQPTSQQPATNETTSPTEETTASPLLDFLSGPVDQAGAEPLAEAQSNSVDAVFAGDLPQHDEIMFALLSSRSFAEEDDDEIPDELSA